MKESRDQEERLPVSEEEWRRRLTPEQYHVFAKGEPSIRGAAGYYHWKETGTFLCAACGQELFSSDTKYESGSGWPSFWKPVSPEAVGERDDLSHSMRRTEVRCSRCGSHLGHVFEDGPEPTGLRYCINSLSLSFKGRGERIAPWEEGQKNRIPSTFRLRYPDCCRRLAYLPFFGAGFLGAALPAAGFFTSNRKS